MCFGDDTMIVDTRLQMCVLSDCVVDDGAMRSIIQMNNSADARLYKRQPSMGAKTHRRTNAGPIKCRAVTTTS
jgi:hypothetical protein